MQTIIEIESEYGIVRVESVEALQTTSQSFSTGPNSIIKSKDRFENSIEVIQIVSKAILTKLNDVANSIKPDEIEVKVGIKFSAEAGAFIAKTSAEGNLEVMIKWKSDQMKVS